MRFTTMARGEITGKKQTQTADEPKRLPGPPGADATVIEPSAASDPEAPADAAKPAQTDDQAQQAEPSSAASKAIELSAKSEPQAPAKKAKAAPIRGPPVPAAWYSLREFAAAHRLSMAMLYKLKKKGRGPREVAIGSRRYVSFEDAAAWRATQPEAKAAQQQEANAA